ncbi:helix-turn-helix domain-containing protein [Streptomyces sp. NPDC051555]|uniref:helix-turn-helix domain-containing protein n=1 Tax=Streptomyces sp. NPDC051555 TaxID=3365657 RepID=UPI0037B790FC
MPVDHIGQRIAALRRVRRMTQADLARAIPASLSTVKAIERGARNPSADMLERIAETLGVDVARLVPGYTGVAGRVQAALPSISAAIAGYDVPLDPPGRSLRQLTVDIGTGVECRLAARYGPIALTAPELLRDALAHLHAQSGPGRALTARLVVAAARTADAVAYKYGAHDLSARLIEVMRWAAEQAADPDLIGVVSYVRAETFLAAHSHRGGLVALERALDGRAPLTPAVRGALHMRAAVVAARARDECAATAHMAEARGLAEGLAEGVYLGTAFGRTSVRIHELAVAVGLGGDRIGRALGTAREWRPGAEVPAERRSGYYIDLGRAQLWQGRPDAAFASLRTARDLAPQHVREHPWARADVERIRRLKRGDVAGLSAFTEWIGAV